MTVQVYSLSSTSLSLTKNTTHKPQEKQKIDPNVNLMLLRNTMIKCFLPPTKAKIIDKLVSELYEKVVVFPG